MALAVTRKQKRERDEALRQIDEYSRAKDKSGLTNPCTIPSVTKYDAPKKACKRMEKSLTSEVNIQSKKSQSEQDKLTSELMKGAVSDSTATPAGAATPQAAGAATPQATDDMTKYLAIGGVGLLLLGGVAYFLLRKPSASAPAPAK